MITELILSIRLVSYRAVAALAFHMATEISLPFVNFNGQADIRFIRN